MGKVLAQDEKNDEARRTFFVKAFGENSGYIGVAMKVLKENTFREGYIRYPEELDKLLRWINSNAEGRELYYCPQLLSKPKRLKQNVESCPSLWADLDEVSLEEIQPEPSITVTTSPGRYQALWLLDVAADPHSAEDASRRLAYALKGDPSGWDLTQLLRIPLTYNNKYAVPEIVTAKISDKTYKLSDFDSLKDSPAFKEISVPREVTLDPQQVLAKYRPKLLPHAFTLFHTEPTSDWSSHLWSLECLLAEAGMTVEEVYAVAAASKCNKYSRDGRGAADLWREVVKAKASIEARHHDEQPPVQLPELLTDEERDFLLKQDRDFVLRYCDQAKKRSDAAWEYHEAGALLILSSILSDKVQLPTSFGVLRPNLWLALLGDTTLSRKAQPLDAKVLTPWGWRRMGDIQVGNEVVGKNGKATKVIGISPQTVEEVYRVVFSDGSSTECTGDHLWLHKRPGKRSKWSLWTLDQIRSKPLKFDSAYVRHIPFVEPVQYKSVTKLPIDPYALGLLIGDGGLSQRSIKFTNIDEDILESLRSVLPPELSLRRVPNTITYGIPSRRGTKKQNPWINALKKLDLWGRTSPHKFIPETYKRSSVESRLSLIQGIMDTDGWVRNGGACICVSSNQLAKDVQELAWSLGGWASFREEGPRKFVVALGLPIGMNPFRLHRKASKYKRSFGRARSIRSIEPVGKKTVQCIVVAARDGLYVTDDYVITHNSTAMEMAMAMLRDVNEDAILATDGSSEGILSALAQRNGRTSLFWRDEWAGMLESVQRRDYHTGMVEAMTNLYDGKFLKRQLRREVVEVHTPIFLQFVAGIKSRILELLDRRYVLSGFVPRFIFFIADTDMDSFKPIGPPLPKTSGDADGLYDEVGKLEYNFSSKDIRRIGNQTITSAKAWDAELTPEAWDRYNVFEKKMVQAGVVSDEPDAYTPSLDRLSKSTLKTAVLLAAARRGAPPVVVEVADVLRAIEMAERWAPNTILVVQQSGKTVSERSLERAFELVRKGKDSRAGLMRSMHLTSREMDLILDTLEQRGMVIRSKHGRVEKIFPSSPQ